MTLLTTIIVATPSVTLMIEASAIYRVRRYRQQSRNLYMANPLAGRDRSNGKETKQRGRHRMNTLATRAHTRRKHAVTFLSRVHLCSSVVPF